MNCNHKFSCGVCSECGIAWSVYAEQVIKERDTLTKQLTELREIAEGLAESIVDFHGPIDDDMHKPLSVALTRFTQWKEKNEK